MKQKVRLGVGELARFLFRSGSIDNRFGGTNRLRQGQLIHQKLQQEDKDKYTSYESEVPVCADLSVGEVEFELSGRIDALYDDDGTVIEEIKTTQKRKSDDFIPSKEHLAQLYTYGLLYLKINGGEKIRLKLRYYHVFDECETIYLHEVSYETLERYVKELLRRFIDLSSDLVQWRSLRDKTAGELSFIYPKFRKGQREMALAVYNTLKREDKVLIEAPTGIGKTAGSLFPAVKILPDYPDHQIYYLTAKTTIQKEAVKTLEKLRENGLKIRSAVITAKDKVCLCDKDLPSCNPDDCLYAKNFYDKITDVLRTSLSAYDHFDAEVIEELAVTHEMCPYHLSLELAGWSDVVICDYNYCFSPVSRLQEELKNKIVLIDEAHNLPDRSREMFSCELKEEDFRRLLESLKKNQTHAFYKKLIGATREVIDVFEDLNEENKEPVELLEGETDLLFEKLSAFQFSAMVFFNRVKKKNLVLDPELSAYYQECSRQIYTFLFLQDFYEKSPETFSLYKKSVGPRLLIKLACHDASDFIDEILDGVPSVFFSATLTPFTYYEKALLGDKTLPHLAVPSPFERDHLKLICDCVTSTRYGDREKSYAKIAKEIYTFVRAKKGHYLVFFPSYQYLEKVLEEFELFDIDSDKIMVQNKKMTEKDRLRFIERFGQDLDDDLIGFCVMGGIFSEGIDLPQKKLLGSVIVGPGLPGMDFERNKIKEYYNERFGDGFSFAYAYPGMNRVLQSIGRVIRSEDDRGSVLLIDDRFRSPYYRKMMPSHLNPEYHRNLDTIENSLKDFWSEGN